MEPVSTGFASRKKVEESSMGQEMGLVQDARKRAIQKTPGVCTIKPLLFNEKKGKI